MQREGGGASDVSPSIKVSKHQTSVRSSVSARRSVAAAFKPPDPDLRRCHCYSPAFGRRGQPSSVEMEVFLAARNSNHYFFYNEPIQQLNQDMLQRQPINSRAAERGPHYPLAANSGRTVSAQGAKKRGGAVAFGVARNPGMRVAAMSSQSSRRQRLRNLQNSCVDMKKSDNTPKAHFSPLSVFQRHHFKLKCGTWEGGPCHTHVITHVACRS